MENYLSSPSFGDFAALVENEDVMQHLVGFLLFQQKYESAIKEIRTKLDILNSEFNVRHGHNPIHHIESRLKRPVSIMRKLERNGCELTLAAARENLMDIAGIRVICSYIEDVYRVASLLTQHDDLFLVRTKDYIKNPKPNGYRSLHLIIQTPVCLSDRAEMVPVEIQIRTVAMDFWASLEHEIRYKTNNEIPENIHRELKGCAEISAALDAKMQEIYVTVVDKDEPEQQNNEEA